MFEDFDRAQFKKDLSRPKVDEKVVVKKGEEWAGVDGWVVVLKAGPKFVTYHYTEGKKRYKPYRRPTAEFLKYFMKSK